MTEEDTGFLYLTKSLTRSLNGKRRSETLGRLEFTRDTGIFVVELTTDVVRVRSCYWAEFWAMDSTFSSKVECLWAGAYLCTVG